MNDSEVLFLSPMLPDAYLLGIPLLDFDRFTINITYGGVLGDIVYVEDSGSAGSSTPVIVLVIVYLSSRFDCLSTRNATQISACTARSSRTPQYS